MVELKTHAGIYAVWAIVLIGVGALLYAGKIEWPIGAGFLVTLGLPSLLGKKVES